MDRILVINAGGTGIQTENEHGALAPSDISLEEIVDKSGSREFADVTVEPFTSKDSSQLRPTAIAKLATKITRAIENYAGVVIATGTDYMARTAASIHYLTPSVTLPVVLTGAQIPYNKPDSDFPRNLRHAVMTAKSDLGETVVAFYGKILRGVHTVKTSTKSFDAFSSPRLSQLGFLDVDALDPELFLFDHRIKRGKSRVPDELKHFHKPYGFDNAVEFYRPGSDPTSLGDMLRKDNVHGVVFIGGGTGTADERHRKHIHYGTKRGKPVVIVTDVAEGAVDLNRYAAGQTLSKAGAISGLTLTPEAALAKLKLALYLTKDMYSTGFRKGLRKTARIAQIIQAPYGGDIISSDSPVSSNYRPHRKTPVIGML